MQQTVSGPFKAQHFGAGTWRLCAGMGFGREVYLQGAGPAAPDLFTDASITALTVEWRPDGVLVAVIGITGVRHLNARSVIIHEPKGQLYENLTLANFDSDARRFWKRVFRLMRIPGGRFLLGFIARRKSGTGSQ